MSQPLASPDRTARGPAGQIRSRAEEAASVLPPLLVQATLTVATAIIAAPT